MVGTVQALLHPKYMAWVACRVMHCSHIQVLFILVQTKKMNFLMGNSEKVDAMTLV